MKTFFQSFLQVLAAFAVFFAGLALLLGAYGVIEWNFEPVGATHLLAMEAPRLKAAPRVLPDQTVAALSGKSVNALGYTIQFPWDSVERRFENGSYVSLTFKGGAHFSIFGPPDRMDVAHMATPDPAHFRTVSTAEQPGSNLPHEVVEMQVVSEDVEWWAFRKHSVLLATMLFGNFVDAGLNKAIYKLNIGEMHGYQCGDPATDHSPIQLQLFDRQDRHYDATISGGDSGMDGSTLTQAQINAIVASMRPLP